MDRIHQILLNWSGRSKIILKLTLPLLNHCMNIWHNLERFIEVQDAKRLWAIQRGTIAKSHIGKRVFHVPEKARIPFLSLNKVRILVQDIFNRLVKSSLIDHLNLEIWGFEAKLFYKCLLLVAALISLWVFAAISLVCLLCVALWFCTHWICIYTTARTLFWSVNPACSFIVFRISSILLHSMLYNISLFDFILNIRLITICPCQIGVVIS